MNCLVLSVGVAVKVYKNVCVPSPQKTPHPLSFTTHEYSNGPLHVPTWQGFFFAEGLEATLHFVLSSVVSSVFRFRHAAEDILTPVK